MRKISRIMLWLVATPVIVFCLLFLSGELWQSHAGRIALAVISGAWILLTLVFFRLARNKGKPAR